MLNPNIGYLEKWAPVRLSLRFVAGCTVSSHSLLRRLLLVLMRWLLWVSTHGVLWHHRLCVLRAWGTAMWLLYWVMWMLMWARAVGALRLTWLAWVGTTHRCHCQICQSYVFVKRCEKKTYLVHLAEQT